MSTRQVTTSAAAQAFAVTPSDSADLPQGIARGIFVGGAGNIVARLPNNKQDGTEDVTFTGCLVGTVLPVQVKRVLATNTTATNLLALY